MAFVGLGVRTGALASSALFLRRPNASTRLFSSVLQSTQARRVGAPFAFRSLSTSTPPSSSSFSANSTQLEEVAPQIDLDATSLLTDSINALASNVPPPLQYGDLAALGLCSWWPAGFVEWSMELINVSTGMPWFWTIVAGTALWRIICFPFAAFALQSSARLQPHQATVEKNRQDMLAAARSKNQLQLLRAQAVSSEFNKKHGIKPFGALAGLVQIPVTFGTFIAVRKMGLLPVEQLKQSGLALIPDLTLPDPTFIMPVLLCAVINVQISVSGKDMHLTTRPGMGHFMNFMRVFSIFGVYIMSDFSAALLVSLLTTSTFTLLQTIFLQRPSIRRALGLPVHSKEQPNKLPSLLESLAYARKSLNDYIEEGKVAQQQQKRR